MTVYKAQTFSHTEITDLLNLIKKFRFASPVRLPYHQFVFRRFAKKPHKRIVKERI